MSYTHCSTHPFLHGYQQVGAVSILLLTMGKKSSICGVGEIFDMRPYWPSFVLSGEAKYNGIDQELNRINQGLNGIDQELNGVDQGLIGIDQELNGIDQGLNGIDQGLNG